MNKHTKKDCLKLIEEKKLPFEIRRIAQTDRLVSITITENRITVSDPIFSWDKLFDKLDTMKSNVVETPVEDVKDDSLT